MFQNFCQEYLQSVVEKYKTGQAKEHAYRPALEKLFKDITDLKIINEPKRSEYGAPDFVFMKNKISAAYAEAKDIDANLDEVEKSEQLARYFGYSNLILTNYLEFRFFRNGQKQQTVKIASIKNNNIEIEENNFSLLVDTIKQFIDDAKEPIKSGAILAKVMAGKARRIRDNIKIFLKEHKEEDNKSLLAIFATIKKLLLADLDYEKFADMYAQTIVYGLFAARYNDKTAENFSRAEARDLLSASNPFLRHFFDHIAGADFDKRLEYMVNELCEEFTHADVRAIVHDYYKIEKDDSRDPIIHFYEDFLQEYDSAERKKMGVFYTPLPVVRFIVRAIDEILQKEFALNGLADSSLTEIKGMQGVKKKQQVHKVQILDPATGTGTFLHEVISYIKKSFVGQEGRWQSYAKENLLPRLHGFEIMMASYTIAHLKLSTLLQESGVDTGQSRLGIYLTNSLEKAENWDNTLFANLGFGQAITDESIAAGKVKNDLPIMVVLGNPPYSGESTNVNYTDNNVYKVEIGGKEKLKERNSKWINDDYVKFIRFAESLIEKNGEGLIGMITAHGYIDNPTFRGMRWHLRNTFDKIYILDLHGNSNKKETNLDGSKDENVFDIKTGVSIILGVKKRSDIKNKKFAEIYKADFYGLREEKFEKLNNLNIRDIKWTQLPQEADLWLLEGKGKEEYVKGFSVAEIFPVNSVGIVTSNDAILIHSDKKELLKNITDFYKTEPQEIFIQKISYRPFDNKFLYFDTKLVERSREKIMQYFINRENIGIIFRRAVHKDMYGLTFVVNKPMRADNYGDFSSLPQVAPLYLYSNDGTKVPNLKKEIVAEIEKIVGETMPENILDYIYAVLHSPSYREKYKEFLKIDFPRVPYPKDKKEFFALAKLGQELRGIHLLESSVVNKFITTYPIAGDNLVEKIIYQDEKVFINKTQYFGGVPEIAWNFYIGGYQPAQKWLKDRKGRILSDNDIEHYQKIIVALSETARIMGEIDKEFKF